MSDQMLLQKRYTRSTEDAVGVEDEVVEEVVEATEEDMINALRNGVGGATPTPTTLKTAGKRMATATNEHGTVISNLLVATNVANLGTYEGTVQREERNGAMETEMEMAMAMAMAMAMEIEMDMEVDIMVREDMGTDKERASTDKVGMDPDTVDMDLDNKAMDPDTEDSDRDKDRQEPTDKS
jgi:hypothetical protein